MMRLLRYVLWNVALGGLLVLGPVQGGEIASNMTLGLFWFMAISTPLIMIMLCFAEASWQKRKEGEAPPIIRDKAPVDPNIDIAIDVVYAVLLLGCGWIFTGLAWIFHTFIVHALIQIQADMRGEKAEKEEPTWTRV